MPTLAGWPEPSRRRYDDSRVHKLVRAVRPVGARTYLRSTESVPGASLGTLVKILVLGATGLIGSHVAEHIDALGHEVLAPTRRELDVLDPTALPLALAGNVRGDATAIDIVINCAAIADTDRAEVEPREAWRLNAHAPEHLARTCYRRGVRFIHLSTELVLGASSHPDESASCQPVGIYARTKAEGEARVLNQTAGTALIVRTQSVYGHGGRNWSSAIAGKLLAGEAIRVDTRRLVVPNSAIEVARALGRIVVLPIVDVGIAHISAQCSPTTWFDWCQQLARELGIDPDLVIGIEHEYRVTRPNIALANSTSCQHHGAAMRSWQDALAEYARVVREIGP